MFRKNAIYLITINSKLGITNKTLSISQQSILTNTQILTKNKVYDIFMFNSSGICFLEKQNEILFSELVDYNEYKIKIKNIAHLFILHQKRNMEMIKNKNKDNIYINQIDNNAGNDYIFNYIETDLYKILILMKSDYVLVGTFPKSCSKQFQQLLLFHIFIGLNNFKGDIINISRKLNEFETYDEKSFTHIKDFYNSKKGLTTKECNDILEILIFENIFLKTLVIHFTKVFYEIFKKEDLNLKQIKLKNLYMVDINSAEVMLDMNKIQGIKSKQRNKKFYKCEKLYEEIIYQSKAMYNNYIKEYDMKFTNADSDFRFVKFECTSTYPRLLFIIRFIPILKGISIIHVYSQKKLSRNNDNNIQMEQGINCKEVDFIFGSFIKGNKNFEFKYGAPKKLEYIEKFMEEFFLTGRSSLNIFKVNNQNKKYKYVNYDIIGIINSFQISKSMGVDEIFKNFKNKLKQEFEKDQKAKKENDQEMNDDDSNNTDDENNEVGKKMDKIFSLNKETFYSVLLNIKPEESKNKKNKEIKNINIISGDMNNKNNDLDENLNINNLVNINSERINFVDENTLSLFDTTDKKRLTNKGYNLENTSMLSEVKLNEKFEIKIVNPKKAKQEENKEATDDRISNNSLLPKEKNINEILELISSSSPKYSENKKILENSKESESIENFKNRKKNKLALIDKDD